MPTKFTNLNKIRQITRHFISDANSFMFRHEGAIIREFFQQQGFVGTTSISGAIRPLFRHKSNWWFHSYFSNSQVFSMGLPLKWRDARTKFMGSLQWFCSSSCVCPSFDYPLLTTFCLRFLASIKFCFWYSERFIPKPSRILTLSCEVSPSVLKEVFPFERQCCKFGDA
jgi:hypothetical protein